MSRARDFADLAGSADAGGLTGKNMVVNGSVAVSQRGTSFSAPNGTYTLDRMRCAQANSADTISQQTFTAGQTDVPGSPKNYLRFAFGAATANRVLETRIEDVYTGSGQSITLSFYAKASAAHTSTIEMTQSFGSGGSSDVAFGTQSYDITTSWQRFEFTLSCPSISGKTIGAGNYLSAAFIRSLSAGPSINVDIALLQLEIGEQATPFEHRSFGDEYNRCLRYTYVPRNDSTSGSDGSTIATGYCQTGSVGVYFIEFPVPMRDIPGLTTISTADSLEQAYHNAAVTSHNVTAMSYVASISGNQKACFTIGSASFSGGEGAHCRYAKGVFGDGTSKDNIIIFSSEL